MADHPEFETEHTPRGAMVWVPVPYFDKLCRMAYGRAPDPNIEALPPEVPIVQQPEARPLEYVPPSTVMEAQGFIPRGYAAQRLKETQPQEVPDDS